MIVTKNKTTNVDMSILTTYQNLRQATLALCESLDIEDYGLQAMPDVSPPKWHLAHTSWFFETFILKPFDKEYRPLHPVYEYMFNSYYHGVGDQYPRAQRGLLSRPTLPEILEYRAHVDEAMIRLLAHENHEARDTILQRCVLGVQHEQQHQELMCTDIKYNFSFNPLHPALGKIPGAAQKATLLPLTYREFDASDARMGYEGGGFHFDNESPIHTFHLPAFRFANRLITNAEFREFMQADGYNEPGLWLSDGWVWKQANHAKHPYYWVQQDDDWFEYTLYGRCPLDPDQPVSHVNYYEADAYARWCGKRLPSEQEWEAVCQQLLLEPAHSPVTLHPCVVVDDGVDIVQMFGSLWQWTRSAYSAYPGYRPAEGAIGEYNGKFMCNQMVLRGSSCVTPPGHARASYRNFFYPKDQWQFTGIRLADDP